MFGKCPTGQQLVDAWYLFFIDMRGGHRHHADTSMYEQRRTHIRHDCGNQRSRLRWTPAQTHKCNTPSQHVSCGTPVCSRGGQHQPEHIDIALTGSNISSPHKLKFRTTRSAARETHCCPTMQFENSCLAECSMLAEVLLKFAS
jgi:hypothetical protein